MSIRTLDHQEAGSEFLTLQPDASGNFVIPDSEQLFNGSFERSGSDLFIANEGAATFHLPGYFQNGSPADLFDSNGAVLRGDLVELLAGSIAPGQYAQLNAAGSASPIGQVETLDGGASVQRLDGTVETLQVGMKVFQQDLVQTDEGGTVSVTFVDGTIFTLASASRMVIDELIYDPNGDDNSAGFSLIQGGFVFIAGQVAKTGGMDVDTPSSTMGIRGTTVVVQIGTDAGVVTSEVTLTNDPDGDTGVVALFDNDGNLIANITETDTKWVVSAADGQTRELARTTEDELEDSVLIAEAFAAFRAATSRVDAGDTFVSLSDPSSGSLNNQQGNGVDTDLDVNGIDDPEAINPLDDIDDEVESDDILPLDDTQLLIEEDVIEAPTLIAVQGFEDASEDSAITGQATVQNADGIPIVFGLGTQPNSGTATVNPDGTFAFVPDPDFNGTDFFTFTVNGPDGELAQGTVVVEVLPVNDAPMASDDDLTMSEDGIISGTIEANDIDGDVLSYTLQGLPTDGEVLLLQNGTYTYTPDLDFEGTDSFSVLVTDVEGAEALATISITVQGENDAPVIITTTEQAVGSVTEDDGTLSVGGTLVADDPDAGQTPEWSGSADGIYGAFVISANGVWGYTLDPAAAEQLNEGQEVTETFTATVDDIAGGVDTIDVVVTITGTNDLPVLTTTADNLTGDLIEDSGPTSVSGTLMAQDADADANLTWETSAIPSLGTFSVTPQGEWTYTIDPAATQSLAQGETFDEVLSVFVSDGIGAPVAQSVVVRVTGTNDTPVLTTSAGANTGTVTEVAGAASTSGVLSATDVDNNAQVTWGGTSLAVLGTFTLGTDGAWSYDLDPDLADSLGQGETAQEVFNAVAQDEFGASVEQSIVVTVVGSNDGPVIVTETGENEGALIEDTGPVIASGTLSAVDADGTPTWSSSDTGVYGTFDISAGGQWAYVLTPSSVQFLSQDQQVTETFEAFVTDGISAPQSQLITVTITGTNDAPIITTASGNAVGALIEDDSVVVAAGTLSATDVDGTPEWTGSADGAYGAFVIQTSGAWSYTVEPSAIQFLSQDQQVTETFTAFVSDGISTPQSQLVTVTITGTNDAPVVTSSVDDATGTLTEGQELIRAEGLLVADDPDAGETATWSGSADATYGEFTLASDGAWSYTLDNALADELSVGEQFIESLTATASDGQGGTVEQVIEVTILGTNDRPILSTNTIFETIEGELISGQLSAMDVDGDGTLIFSLGADGPDNGSVVINPDGSFEYTPDLGFLGVERFEYQVDDGQGGISTANVTIEVESDPNDPDNENVSVVLNTDATDSTAAGAVEIGINATPVTSVNLAIALDRSTSIGFLQWQELLGSVQDALTDLAATFEGSDTNVDVRIITFATNVSTTEFPDGSDYQLTDPALLDIFNIFDLPYSGGSTSWELAFIEAGDFFFSQDPSESNVLLFVTDGVPTSGTFAGPLNELRDTTDGFDVTINAFGFGDAYEADDLLLIDENATFLEDSSQLSAALQTTPIFNPELLSLQVELQADDGETIVIADETSDALIVEGTDFELPLASIENILDFLGESNRISITTQFDVNNDPSASEIELFSTDVIGKADTAQTSEGNTGADLIFGSDFADVINGAAGDDILLGFDGNDTLDGGTGSDTLRAGDGDDRIIMSDAETAGDDIDGGGGRDKLAIDAIADINGLLSSLDLSGIEVVDTTNGQLDNLTLTFEDIFQLSDTGDDVLNAYLGVAESNSLVLNGDGNDTLQLDGGNTYDIDLTGQVDDGTGNLLNVYEFSIGGGNALATLGVDSDIAVTTTSVPVG